MDDKLFYFIDHEKIYLIGGVADGQIHHIKPGVNNYMIPYTNSTLGDFEIKAEKYHRAGETHIFVKVEND